MRRFFVIFLACFLFYPAISIAGSFKASPIKLFFETGVKTAALKIINEKEEKLTVELEAFEWTQDADGKDRYAPAKDIVFFPKIAVIKKGAEKIIRVGYEGKRTDMERAYRLYVQEVPVSRPGEAPVKMTLRMGIPIFVKPAKELRQLSLDKIDVADAGLKVSVANAGNSHALVRRVRATGVDVAKDTVFSREIGGWYVLAGRTKTYAIGLSARECARSKEIKVSVDSGGSMIEGGLEVSGGICPDESPGTGK